MESPSLQEIDIMETFNAIRYNRQYTSGPPIMDNLIAATIITSCGEMVDVMLESITWSESREVLGVYNTEDTIWTDDGKEHAQKYQFGKQVIVGSVVTFGPANIFESFKHPFAIFIDNEYGTTLLTGVSVTQHTTGYSANDLACTSGFSFVALGLKSVNK